MAERTRSGVNVVVPKRIYQRGKIFTWTRERKLKLFDDFGITGVVNFWPKVDVNLEDLDLDCYWQLSCPRSEQMLQPHIMQAAVSIADYLKMKNTSVLVLCEAGKTRSVFFCVLLVAQLYPDYDYDDALKHVLKNVPSHSLKGFMYDWLKEKDR